MGNNRIQLHRHKLGELIDVTRGMSLPGSNYATYGELIRLTLGNFDYSGNGFKENTSKDNIYYSGAVPDEYIMKEGDIITPLTEQTPGLLGTTARIPVSGKYIQSQDVALITCKPGKIDPLFCYYLVSSSIVKQQLAAGSQQTKIRHTSPDKIKECVVYIPEDLAVQHKIGDFLTAIDDKISLNRKANAELEALAKQIYDYWFVQFDFPDANGRPYKSSGGKMVYDKELKRMIPEDWKKATLLDIANYTNGLACQNHRPKEGEQHLPVIKIKEMRDGFTPETEEVSVNIPESVKVYNGDILFSWSASLEVIQWAFGEGGLNQHIFKVTGKEGFPKNFYYFQILNYVEVFRKIAEARKTTMGHITQDHLKQSRIAIPSEKSILERFDDYLKPVMDNQVKLIEEISSLKGTRDFLLPLLLNEQVSIA